MQDGENHADPENQEFDALTENAVAEAEPQNGNHIPAPAVPTVRRVETVSYPEQVYTPPAKPLATRRHQPVRRESQKDLTNRDIIQNIVDLPESVDWEFRVSRMPGSKCADGASCTTGHLDVYDTMPVDTLCTAIQQEWGGGTYKIVPHSKSDHSPILDNPKVRCAFIGIDGPSKNEKGGNPTDDSPDVPPTEEDEELRDIARRRKIALEEERENNANARRLKSRSNVLELEKKMRDLSKDDNGGGQNSAIEILRVQMENDRKIAEERARADRELFMASIKTLGDNINKVAELAARPAPTPPPDKTGEILAAMQKSQTDLLTSLLPALIGKKDDGGQLEFIKYTQENNRLMFDSLNKQGAKETSTERDLVRQLMNQLIQMATGPKNSKQEFDLKAALELIKQTRKETLDIVQMSQRNNDDDGGAPGTSWDDKKGLGANLFGMLKEVISIAVGSPGGQQLLMKIFNKENPSDGDVNALAARIEAEDAQRMLQGAPPQQLAGPQQVRPMQPIQQDVRPMQPIITPPPGVPSVPLPQRQPMPQRPVAPQTGVPSASPPVSRPAPAPVAAQPAQRPEPTPVPTPDNPPTPAELSADADAAASQIEADISGVPHVIENAADVQQEVHMPREVVTITHSEQPVQQADDAEMRLRDKVTEAMEMAIENVNDAIAVHDWPEFAITKWNGAFLQYLRAAPDDQTRFRIIGSRCHPEVFTKLNQTLESSRSEPPQWTAFYDGVRMIVG